MKNQNKQLKVTNNAKKKFHQPQKLSYGIESFPAF